MIGASEGDGESLIRRYAQECSNHGRWGEHDERGTLNYVGPEQVRAAAGLVRRGRVVSMGLPLDQNGPQRGGPRPNPRNVMTATGTDHLAGTQVIRRDEPTKGFGYADDMLITANQAGTQWDALCHVFWEGQMWNGRSAGEVSARGAAFAGIQSYRGSMVMRGVLLDVARHKGVESLEPGDALGPDVLEQTADAQGVELRTGDALLVRTGFLGARRPRWGDYAGGHAPGLSLHTAPWLHRTQIAAVASDTWGLEVRPNEIDTYQPLHVIALVYMGLPIGEIFDLEEVSTLCAAQNTWEFLFVAPPLPITGAAGSPVNPLAIL